MLKLYAMTKEIFVKMALKSWHTQIKGVDRFLESKNDESLNHDIAPGKNSIRYLLGHLIAANDSMLSLFGLGERQYTHLDEAFLKNKDKAGLEMPDAAWLRTEWLRSNEILSQHFETMSADDWFSKHTAMTDEDLAADPGRNRLSVLINRTNHVAYHLGQLILAKAIS